MANLSSDLQASIDNLQTEHTKLVQAVRDYTGGSVAAATNDLLAAAADTDDSIVAVEKNLLGMINRSNEDKLPSLILDFVNDVALTGTRSVSQGTTIDALMHNAGHFQLGNAFEWGPDGKLKQYEPLEPAYAYDPKTGERLGLALREGGSNLVDGWLDLESSMEFTPASNGRMVDEPNPVDGGQSLLLTSLAGEDGSTYFSQRLALSANRTYCHSVMVKPSNITDNSRFRLTLHSNQYGASKYISFYPETATVASDLPAGEYGVDELSNGWYRVWGIATTAASISSNVFAFIVWPLGTDEDSGWYVSGAQVIQSSDHGLIMPSGEQRYPDDLRLDLTNSWYNPLQFSAVADYILQIGSESRFALSFYRTGSQYLGVDYRVDNLGYVIPGAGIQGSGVIGVPTIVGRRKSGISFREEDGVVLSRMGNAIASYAGLSRRTDYFYLILGNRKDAFYASGIYRELKVYSRFLNKEEMEAETAL